MIYHFSRPGVVCLLQHALAAQAFRPLPLATHTLAAFQPLRGTKGAGLWLLADHGVYLVSNGIPPLGPPQHRIYALECDPVQMAFGDWRATLRAGWGEEAAYSVAFLPALPLLWAVVAYPHDTLLPIEVEAAEPNIALVMDQPIGRRA